MKRMKRMKQMKQMKRMKKAILLLLLLVMSSTLSKAQSTSEMSIHAAGGLSTLNYDLLQGNKTCRLGGELGFGYTYFFNEKWGLGTGLGLGLYRAQLNLDGTTSVIPDLTNEYGYAYELHTALHQYTEKQWATFLNIPLMVQLQTPIAARRLFYARGGFKVGIPLSASATARDGSLTNMQIYPDMEGGISEPKFMGLGTFEDRMATEKLRLNPVFFAAAEAGVKWLLSDKIALYTGLYFDYGINDARKDKDKMFVRQNAADPEHFTTNSAVTAQDFVGKASPLAAGVLLRLVWGKAPKKNQENAPAEILPEPVADTIAEKRPENDTIAQVQEPKAEEAPADKPAAQEQEPKAEPVAEKAPADKPAAQVQDPKAKPVVEEAPEDDIIPQEKSTEASDMAELEGQIAPYEINQIYPAATALPALSRKVSLLKRYPFIHLLLVGNTCDLGSHELNMRIGKQRADAVKAYMVKRGIASKRIQTVSFGKTRPLAPADKAQRKANRRVEVVVIKP